MLTANTKLDQTVLVVSKLTEIYCAPISLNKLIHKNEFNSFLALDIPWKFLYILFRS